MQKVKLILLNLICVFLIAYLAMLTWKQLVVSTPFYDNDYKTFYMTLRGKEDVYRIEKYFPSQTINHQKKISAQTTPPINAINLNTPTMNIILRSMVNASNQLSQNVLLWTIATFIGAAISILLLMQTFLDKKYYYFFPFVFMLCLSWPSLYNVKLGQLTYFVLPILCAAFLLMHFKQWRTMTVVLGLLAALKIFFLIFLLYFIARKQWRLALLFIISFAVFFFFPLFYFSWKEYHAFFLITLPHLIFVERAILPMNGSLLGVIASWVSFLKIQSSVKQISVCASILVSYAVVRYVIYDYRFLRHLPAFSNELSISFLIVLALICSPLSWLYYFLFLLIPLVVVFKITQHYLIPTSYFVFLCAALVLPFFALVIPDNKMLYIIAHNCLLQSLLYWILILFLLARVIMKKQVVSAQRAHTQNVIFFGIMVSYVALCAVLLSSHYGLDHFVNLDKKNYLNKVAPVVWLS